MYVVREKFGVERGREDKLSVPAAAPLFPTAHKPPIRWRAATPERLRQGYDAAGRLRLLCVSAPNR